jgi:RHS repeat-associated protein
VRNEKGIIRQPIRFQGQYHDEESGLYYNRFRFYDPLQGRYVTQDPIGLLGGLNSFIYPTNPVEWVDPLGLRKVPSPPKGVDSDDWACAHGDKLACQRIDAENDLRNASIKSRESATPSDGSYGDNRGRNIEGSIPTQSGNIEDTAVNAAFTLGTNGMSNAPGALVTAFTTAANGAVGIARIFEALAIKDYIEYNATEGNHSALEDKNSCGLQFPDWDKSKSLDKQYAALAKECMKR